MYPFEFFFYPKSGWYEPGPGVYALIFNNLSTFLPYITIPDLVKELLLVS
jgi:hypothetical protein